MDLIISNCVVNLSADKRAVLREAFRVLADGGEFHFSDVYCDRRLPAHVRSDPVLVGECLGARIASQAPRSAPACGVVRPCSGRHVPPDD